MNRTATAVVSTGAVIGILLLLGQALLYRALAPSFDTRDRAASAAPVGTTTISCWPAEQLATHYHVALLIHREGRIDRLPGRTGIEATCIYWIHVHDDSGIVHVEAPASYANHVFVLGDAFAVARMALDAHHLGSATFPSGRVAVYDNGVEFSGAPASQPLIEGDTIDVVAPGERYTYRPFDWPPGFLAPIS